MEINEFFSNKTVLITGGTGSLGKFLTNYLLVKYPDIKKIIIYSRDEQKQFQMAQQIDKKYHRKIRYFIGDVRDLYRLEKALEGVDFVVHAAAMKHVHISEYNPDECVKTNIIGAQNLISSCLKTNVSRVVALSTDKACAPVNLYGATKLASDKLFIAANYSSGCKDIKFSVVRYGNVMNSNGSVIPFFKKQKESGFLTITNEKMTRFNITLERAVEMIIFALCNAWGGELFVPKLKSFRIMDLAKSIGPDCQLKTIGLRPGEKIHEEMIATSDSFYTYDIGSYYVILPVDTFENSESFMNIPKWKAKDYIEYWKADKVPEMFSYNSFNNTEWETEESLIELIKNYT
jgi:UDP-N-acetylglucosamine 4,6-dehydratase (inverting)